MKLQNAVSAVIEWRLHSAEHDSWSVCKDAEFIFSSTLYICSLNPRLCAHWIDGLPKIASCLHVYVIAAAFLYVAYKITRIGLIDNFVDSLTTLFGQFVVKQRHSNHFSSVLSLSQTAKLMKVVVNNSRSIVQLIKIELSKAYLYRALRCKDSDSDSIYCLSNVYLAVL